jgi:membrane carboxypeptidase/penicillin-binding protein
MLSTARKASLVALVVLSAYLAGVAIWSLASVQQVADHYGAQTAGAGLSKQQTAILLRVEDPTFFTHRGLSVGSGQGFATISSALARDGFLYDAHFDGIKGTIQSIYRRVFECCKKVDIGRDVMALVLNAHLSKERQLSAYVARVYMGTTDGAQVRGLQQAATTYIGKPLDRLTDPEFARLVAMIKAPNYFHPVKNRPAYDLRVARVNAILSGKCVPSGWFDTAFAHCKR